MWRFLLGVLVDPQGISGGSSGDVHLGNTRGSQGILGGSQGFPGPEITNNPKGILGFSGDHREPGALQGSWAFPGASVWKAQDPWGSQGIHLESTGSAVIPGDARRRFRGIPYLAISWFCQA